MHPISLRFVATQIGLLAIALVLGLLVQDLDHHGVLIAADAIFFVFGAKRVARHVVSVNRRDRRLGWISVFAVICLAIAFAALFLSSTLAFAPFLLFVLAPFVYYAFTT
jgi:uncharacterized membrane protein